MKIGVWGYGIVGKSIVNFFKKSKTYYLNNLKTLGSSKTMLGNNNDIIEIIDKKELNQQEKLYLEELDIKFRQETNIERFFELNDKVICSPGIDLTNYLKFQNKIITEIDLFNQYWQKPIIAITGTIGKTSITHLLSQILIANQFNIITGGNIGFAMLDFIDSQIDKDFAILELSSFQLEYIKNFSPDLAIWTNFYPNHLDRHKSLENYFEAKIKIILNQNEKQKALLPIELQEKLVKIEKLKNRNIYYFSSNLDIKNLKLLKPDYILYYIEDNSVFKYKNNQKTFLINLNEMPNLSFKENWLILTAACDILNVNINKILNANNLNLPNHRLNLVDKINGVEYYNDSKSTLCESTLAAINSFDSNNIHLFLGGTSKGVDRSWLIEKVKNKVKAIYCFGKESEELYQAIKKSNINGYKFFYLGEAFDFCLKNTQSGDIVLLSPSGASYDQFSNFEERGKYFINLINNYKTKSSLP